MSRRRIAVITARADDTEQREILCGISNAAFEADTDVAVYSNIYNHWVADEQLNFENIIYELFEPRHYDGAIITAEAFMDTIIPGNIVKRLREAKCPTVVIGKEIKGFRSVLSNDEDDMEQVADHLIDVHGFTDIDILAGPGKDPISNSRIAGCKRAFDKHGMPFDRSKLYHGNFWEDSGEALAKRYINGELPLPQAIICANDYMAYGLCDTLAAAGISVPERVTVTGYDYMGYNQAYSRIFHYPLLTSFRRSRQKMGADAVNMLLGTNYIANDEKRLVSGSSCPCGADIAELEKELHTARMRQHYNIISSVAQFSGRLTLCRTLAEYASVLGSFFYPLNGADTLYLCLDAAWNSAKYEGEEFLCCKISGNNINPVLTRYNKKELPPALSEERKTPSIFYFSPLHFQTRLFGYTVLSYSYPGGYDFSFRDWNKTVSDTLEFLRMKNDIHYLKQCQSVSLLYDSLTGFCSPGEFRHIVETAGIKGCLFAVKLSFPENGEYLYGENYRSEITAAAARAIKRTCTDREICSRADEDMFFILCGTEREVFEDKLKVMLHNTVRVTYDERQVLISYVVLPDNIDERSPEQLYAEAARKAEQEMARLSERKNFQHYNALLDIRNTMMASPQKASDLSEISRSLCVSEGYFRSIYKRCFDVSYNRDCINAKMLKARYLLCTTAMSVYAVSVNCGYADEKYFSRLFKQNAGCSPMQYRKSNSSDP